MENEKTYCVVHCAENCLREKSDYIELNCVEDCLHEKSYCIRDGEKTGCIQPKGYCEIETGRVFSFCHCSNCGMRKMLYVKPSSLKIDELREKGLINDFKQLFACSYDEEEDYSDSDSDSD